MTVLELYKYFNDIIPSALSCEWDNDGLMCCPDGGHEVRRALVCLDVTEEAVNEAIKGGFDVIVSHHPFIFKGLKSLDDEKIVSRKAMKLIKADIAVMSFHTRLDAVEGGVNDTLAKLLGISDAVPFGEGIGRIGTLSSPLSLSDFAKLVKTSLCAPAVSVSDTGKEVYKVAVLGGSGDDEIGASIAAGADTYVSGELGHHPMTDAPDMGINLIEAGHFYTEEPVCEVLAEKLSSLGIEAVRFNSNRTMVI